MRLIDADALMKDLEKWLKQVDPTHPPEDNAIPPMEDIIVSTLMTIEEQPTNEITQEDVEAYCRPRGLVVMTAELFEYLKRGLPSAQAEQQWIPCSERLPKEKGEYLVAYHPCYWDDVKAEVKVGIDSFRGNTSWAKRKYQRVIAWMPLPKYESEDKE